jgi:hypothetical protein
MHAGARPHSLTATSLAREGRSGWRCRSCRVTARGMGMQQEPGAMTAALLKAVGGLATSCLLELAVYPALFAIWKGRDLAPEPVETSPPP